MRGFTLVELLVVLAIISILTFITLGSFNNFQQRQEVRFAAEELKSNLRKYQNYAVSGQKNPTLLPAGNGCNPPTVDPNNQNFQMTNYTVHFDLAASPPEYWAELVCDNATVELRRIQLPDDFTYFISCDQPIIFLPLSRDVVFGCPGTEVTLRISRGTSIYTVHVARSGSIFNVRN